MIKLICKTCGKTFEFTDHKQAWHDGWDFDKQVCNTKECKPPHQEDLTLPGSWDDEEES